MVMVVLRGAAVLLHNGIAGRGVFLFVFASVVIEFSFLRLEPGSQRATCGAQWLLAVKSL